VKKTFFNKNGDFLKQHTIHASTFEFIRMLDRFDILVASNIVCYLTIPDCWNLWFLARRIYNLYTPSIAGKLVWRARLFDPESITSSKPLGESILVCTKHASHVRRVKVFDPASYITSNIPFKPATILPLDRIRHLNLRDFHLNTAIDKNWLPPNLESLVCHPMSQYTNAARTCFAPVGTLPSSLSHISLGNHVYDGGLVDLFYNYDLYVWLSHEFSAVPSLHLEGTLHSKWLSRLDKVGFPAKINVTRLNITYLELPIPDLACSFWPRTLQVLHIQKTSKARLFCFRGLHLDDCPHLTELSIWAEHEELDFRGLLLPQSLRTFVLDVLNPKKVTFDENNWGVFCNCLPKNLQNLDVGEWAGALDESSFWKSHFPGLERLYVGSKVTMLDLERFPKLGFVARSKTSHTQDIIHNQATFTTRSCRVKRTQQVVNAATKQIIYITGETTTKLRTDEHISLERQVGTTNKRRKQ